MLFRSADFDAELRGRGTPWRNVLTVTLPVAAVIFALTWLLSKSPWIASLPTLLFAAFSGFSNLLYAARISRLQGLIGRDGSVELIEVESAAAENLRHQGSNGPAYCFFSDDGQAILLVGPWLLDTPNFPALHFRLWRIAGTGEPIRLEALSEPITPPTEIGRAHV